MRSRQKNSNSLIYGVKIPNVTTRLCKPMILLIGDLEAPVLEPAQADSIK